MKMLAGLVLLLVAQGSSTTVLQPVGVCSLAGAAPACWGLQGEPKPELLVKLRGLMCRFPADAFPASGKQTRYVVFRSPQDVASVFKAEGSEVANVLTSSNEEGVLNVIRVDPPQGDRDVKVRASLFMPVLPGRELRFGRGARADVDGDRVEIGAITAKLKDLNVADHPERYAPDRRGPLWEAIIGHSSEVGAELGLRFVPLDRHGEPILYVDPNGHPVPTAVGNAVYARSADGAPVPSAVSALFRPEWPGYGSSAAFRCELNIAPRDLAKLRIVRVVAREERYPSLSLEPSGP